MSEDAARNPGAEGAGAVRIIAMSRHEPLPRLVRDLGATGIIGARG